MTAPTRLPLPSSKWLRSPKLPHWALCFDRDSPHYLHKCVEGDGAWIRVHALTVDELRRLAAGELPNVSEEHRAIIRVWLNSQGIEP